MGLRPLEAEADKETIRVLFDHAIESVDPQCKKMVGMRESTQGTARAILQKYDMEMKETNGKDLAPVLN
jgi:hypothetical protein